MNKSIEAPKKKKKKGTLKISAERIRDIHGQTHIPAFSSFATVMSLM